MNGTADITRGASRLMVDLGLAPLLEFPLKSGRRLDILAIGPKSELVAVEVKSSRQDFMSDHKWHEYLDFADQFFFAVAADFPREILPTDEGLIIADRFGGEILRASASRSVATARRKAILLQAARLGALRLNAADDPRPEQEIHY